MSEPQSFADIADRIVGQFVMPPADKEAFRLEMIAALTAERDRCEKLVDPDTTPVAWDSCNAFTCLAAATMMIRRGHSAADLRIRDNHEVSKQLLARRKAQAATRKAAKP